MIAPTRFLLENRILSTFLSFQVYLGGHGFFGEDGLQIKADRAIGRDDYGKAQCSFRKRRGPLDPPPTSFNQISSQCFEDQSSASARQQFEAAETGNGYPSRRVILTPFEYLLRSLGLYRPRSRNVLSKRQGLFGGGPRGRRGRQAFGNDRGRDITFTNDIALVRLSHSVRFSRKIQPVRLPPDDFSYMGYQAYVSGWGIQSPEEGPSPTLKGAELAVSIMKILL